jgi:hypothetical protein
MTRRRRPAVWTRLTPLALAPLSLAAAVLLVACVEADPTSTPEPTFTAQPVLTPVTTPRPTSTPSALEGADLDTLLRTAVCWHDDLSLAADCLPPGPDVVDAIGEMARSGDARLVAPLVDMLWLEVGWERWVRDALSQLTGVRLTSAVDWSDWVAFNPQPLPDGYVEWKGRLLALIDPLYVDLFANVTPVAGDPGGADSDAGGVRPEEVLWSFVGPDDVPPLESPEAVHRLEQRYLDGGDLVTGVLVGGVARAYPDRVLAWHTIVADEVNGVPLLVVRCLACGGVAVYEAEASDGVAYEFGTTGLTYHGRPLLFDRATLSLWDPLSGRAIAGPLANQGVVLAPRPMVHTAWDEWSDRYPNTSTLTLETGHVRDYTENAALSLQLTALQTTVPPRPAAPEGAPPLPPDAPILGVVIGGEARAYPLADLVRGRILHDRLGGREIVLFSLGDGAGVSVFDAEGVTFDVLDGDDRSALEVTDSDGVRWFMDDEVLVNARNSRERSVLPARLAAWDAWLDAMPGTSVWTR